MSQREADPVGPLNDPGQGQDQEPAPAPLSTGQGQVVVDGKGVIQARGYQIAATLISRGGTPLVNQLVLVLDPATGRPVGGAVQTDEQGRLVTEVPEDRAYAVKILDDDEDRAMTPEESGPEELAAGDLCRLWLRVLDEAGQGRAGEPFALSGQGATYEGRTDEDGDIEIDGCAPGVYELRARGGAYRVHTLLDDDLVEDPDPYRLVVA